MRTWALKLTNGVGYFLVATADENGLPHFAAHVELVSTPEKHLSVS
jgi:hypothetical protein